MSIENLKATKDTTGIIGFRETTYNNEKSLLSNDDHYNSLIALKALETLEGKDDVPQFLIPQLKKEIEDRVSPEDFKGMTPRKLLVFDKLYKELFPQVRSTEIVKKKIITAKPEELKKLEEIVEQEPEQTSLLEEPEVIDPNETPKERRERQRRKDKKLREEREQKVKERLASLLSSFNNNQERTQRNFSEYAD